MTFQIDCSTNIFCLKKDGKKAEKKQWEICQWVRGKWWIMESINGCERIFVNFMVDRMLDLCERCVVLKNKWHFVFKISLLLSVKPFKIIIFFHCEQSHWLWSESNVVDLCQRLLKDSTLHDIKVRINIRFWALIFHFQAAIFFGFRANISQFPS